MGLTKSNGNMYDWVSHMHTHLRGECSHKCKYCYVQHGTAARTGYYSGPLRLDEKQLDVKYGKDRIIFIEHCQDLFAKDVPHDWIMSIIDHCCEYPYNDYVFQTKNPLRYAEVPYWPVNSMYGTTLESNRQIDGISEAPCMALRIDGIARMSKLGFETFITIEPVLDFDVDVLVRMLEEANPKFINIGADSKGKGLQEPSANKIRVLLGEVAKMGIQIRQKRNLDRILAK